MVRTAEFLSLTRLSRKFVLNGSLQCIVDFNDIRLWFKDYGSKGKAAGKRGVDGHVVTRRKLHIFAHFCIFPQFLFRDSLILSQTFVIDYLLFIYIWKHCSPKGISG